MSDKLKQSVKEFIRFIICGGIATAVDFVIFGTVIYLISPEVFGYSIIKSIFADRSAVMTKSVLIGTAAGFTAGLIVNYIISVLFVYQFTRRAKSVWGIILFSALSVTGLLLNVLLMKVFYDYAGLNHWIAKVMVTFIVFIYNFSTKRLVIFRP
ncbi:MAG: GtrA family protein [Christensenellales bacterium]|jgi:putative flippase GtrA